jgi:hypothetical protein
MGFLPCPIINVLAMQDPRLVYDLLFESAGNFEKFWKSQRNQTGMIAVLHTWGQNLSLSTMCRAAGLIKIVGRI